jgi:GNAT superfamily N-acetyltransferase
MTGRPRPSARLVRSARRVAPPALLRPAEPDDLEACAHVWRDAIADYLLRLNQPDVVTDLRPVIRLFRHLLATDPAGFWVATRPEDGDGGRAVGAHRERLVGFGSANVRGRAWFLALLFVAPGEQGRGLGTELLARTFPADARPGSGEVDGGWTFGTATDSVQPISNGLYARFGLVPRVPFLHLVGDVRRPEAFPGLPPGVEAVTFDESGPEGDGAVERTVAAIDREILGYTHPQDHAYLRAEGRTGVLFRDADGGPVGYGYTSRVGRLGPVAALDPRLLPAVLGHVLAVVRPTGAFSTWVPGAAGGAVAALLDAGFRLESFPALHCWDRPSVDDSRYIPISLALL